MTLFVGFVQFTVPQYGKVFFHLCLGERLKCPATSSRITFSTLHCIQRKTLPSQSFRIDCFTSQTGDRLVLNLFNLE
jgi:hypothetical protein